MADDLPPGVLATPEAPDLTRCQGEYRPAWSPFRLGPRPGWQRCDQRPVVVVTEAGPGKDGLVGSMALCSGCLAALRRTGAEVVEAPIVEASPVDVSAGRGSPPST